MIFAITGEDSGEVLKAIVVAATAIGARMMIQRDLVSAANVQLEVLGIESNSTPRIVCRLVEDSVASD